MAELNEVMDRLKQGTSQSPQTIETSDTSGDDTCASKGVENFVQRNFPHKEGVRLAGSL